MMTEDYVSLEVAKLLKEKGDLKPSEIGWLKSLKDRYTWKPSDEQMKAIKEAACYSSIFSDKTIDNLISLSKDLKKLKGE